MEQGMKLALKKESSPGKKGIELRQVRVLFGGRPVLENISFLVEQGSLCTLLGPNGAGKTSLIRCLNGFIRPVEGHISILGKDLQSYGRRELSQAVSYVPQHHYPVFSYSVLDFVLLGKTPHLPVFNGPASRDREEALQVLNDLGINHLSSRNYLLLSGGERQLALLARGLVQNTPVMLLDEPTSHLDYHYQHRMLEIVRKMVRERGLTALVSLHDPNLAMEYSDKIIVLQQGRVLAELRCDENAFRLRMEKVLQEVYGGAVKIKEVDKKMVSIRY